MSISTNGDISESADLETLRAWYTMGYLEGLLAGYTNTEPGELDDILVQPESFVPLVGRLDDTQRITLLEMFASINVSAIGGAAGEFQKRRMAQFWHYLSSLKGQD